MVSTMALLLVLLLALPFLLLFVPLLILLLILRDIFYTLLHLKRNILEEAIVVKNLFYPVAINHLKKSDH